MSLRPTDEERKQPTGFLDLSAELRNEIYYHALTAQLPVLVRYQGCVKVPTSELRRRSHYFSSPSVALLRTCRTVRKEATPVFFGNNTLSLPFLGRRLNQFINHVSIWTIHIRSVRLRTFDTDSKIVTALTSLKQLPSLKLLEIVNSPVPRRSREMAQLVLPLVKSVAAAKGKTQIPEEKVLETVGLEIVFLFRNTLGGHPTPMPKYVENVRKYLETLFVGKELPMWDASWLDERFR